MPNLLLDAYPHGKRKALLLSYDDGQVHDRRLVEIFNRHRLRATFHLNSGNLDKPGYLARAEIRDLFRGHEVSVHTVTHPHLPHLPNERIVREIIDDRQALESLVGYPVRGMSYPGGGYDDRVVAMLPMLGITYARTAVAAGENFNLPSDFLRWHPSGHHNRAMELLAKFKAVPPRWGTQVLYIFGHSFDFDRAGNWDLIDRFGAEAAAEESIWNCTHIELIDYMTALSRVQCSADGSIVHNPSATPIWGTVDERIIRIDAGQTLRLG